MVSAGLGVFAVVLITLVVGRFSGLLPKEKLPILPGDFLRKQGNIDIYIPITSSIILSVLILLFLSSVKII